MSSDAELSMSLAHSASNGYDHGYDQGMHGGQGMHGEQEPACLSRQNMHVELELACMVRAEHAWTAGACMYGPDMT